MTRSGTPGAACAAARRGGVRARAGRLSTPRAAGVPPGLACGGTWHELHFCGFPQEEGRRHKRSRFIDDIAEVRRRAAERQPRHQRGRGRRQRCAGTIRNGPAQA